MTVMLTVKPTTAQLLYEGSAAVGKNASDNTALL